MKLVLEKGQRLWFTSDTHYNHANICSATTKWVNAQRLTREFKSLSHMNDALVNNINAVVGENDVLIHLGDWSFGGFDSIAEFRNRLVCKNIHIVLGNHDHHIQRNKEGVQSLFKSVHEYLYLNVVRPGTTKKDAMDRYDFVCMHYPIASWNNMNSGVIHLHGHVHLMPNVRLHKGKAMDVGCEGNNLDPISLDEILNIMKDQPIGKLALPHDHHEMRLD